MRLTFSVLYNELARTSCSFIEFFTQEDAQHAVKILNGKRLGGRKIRVVDHEVSSTAKHISPYSRVQFWLNNRDYGRSRIAGIPGIAVPNRPSGVCLLAIIHCPLIGPWI